MHIGFDNSRRLQRRVYYFEYRGIRYKLIQNPSRKWCDVLLTIIPGKSTQAHENLAYATASEFLSALSWANHSRVKVYPMGGVGVREGFTLRRAKCRIRTFPRIPFCGYTIGADLSCIAQIDTDEQKEALALFREAASSNNDHLSFLFFWQVLAVAGGDSAALVDKIWRKHRAEIVGTREDLFSNLNLNGKRLGEYLREDCRNAIAHIRRAPGKTKIVMGSLEDEQRISISTYIVRQFAMFYLQEKLRMCKQMYLLRRRGRGFPEYVPQDEPPRFGDKPAYTLPQRSLAQMMQKKPWH